MDTNKRQVYVPLFSGVVTPRVALILDVVVSYGYSVTFVSWDRLSTCILKDEIKNRYAATWISVGKSTNLSGYPCIFLAPYFLLKISRVIRQGTVNDIMLIGHYSCLSLANCFPGKILYDVAEMWFFDLSRYMRFLPVSWVKKIISTYESRKLRNITAITTVDSRNSFLFDYYKAKVDQTIVLGNLPSVFLDQLDFNETEIAFTSGFTIVFAGSLDQKRGSEVLVRTMDYISKKKVNINWLFIGPHRGMKDEIIRKFSCNKYVSIKFAGRLSYKAMMKQIEASDIGIALYQESHVPYHQLGMMNARKLFTYMQGGVPVLSCDFGDMAKVIREERAGTLVNTKDVRQISTQILKYKNSPELVRQHGFNGKNAIVKKYNWESEKNKLEKLMVENFDYQLSPPQVSSEYCR